MAVYELNNGTAVVDKTAAAITTSYTAGTTFHAGACAGVGLHLMIECRSRAGGTTQYDVTVERSRDESKWTPVLSVLHLSGGTTAVEQALTITAGAAAVNRLITVAPEHIGTASYVRVRIKAGANGLDSDDSIVIYAAGA